MVAMQQNAFSLDRSYEVQRDAFWTGWRGCSLAIRAEGRYAAITLPRGLAIPRNPSLQTLLFASENECRFCSAL